MQENKLYSELGLRFLTGTLMGSFIIGSIAFSPLLCKLLLIIVAALMFREWYNMTHSDNRYLIAGLPIIAIPISCLLLIIMLTYEYRYILLTYFAIIWTVDSFAMFGGKTIGGPKLAPILSPRKTWSGLIVGVLAGALIVIPISMLPNYAFPYHGMQLSIFAIILGTICQISDLFISFFKRHFHLKDTGDIIPGHGGILDRCDSLILTAPIMLYIVL